MENIYAAAKDRGIKIGELERFAGLSTGYLSKLSKEGNTAVPGIDSLQLIAEKLGISIDCLLNVNYKNLSADEKYVILFLDRLMLKTEAGRITWEIEGASFLNTNKTGENFVHPLFLPIPSAIEDPETGDMVDYVANTYQSRFLQNAEVNYFLNCYHCEFGSRGEMLYLMKFSPNDWNYPKPEIEIENPKSSIESHQEIEVYILDSGGKVNPLCTTYRAGTEIVKVLNKLYATVSAKGNSICVSSYVKGIIEEFMNYDF